MFPDCILLAIICKARQSARALNKRKRLPNPFESVKTWDLLGSLQAGSSIAPEATYL